MSAMPANKEILNNVAEATKKFIVVLNDNEWSIAKNVGAIASYFNKIATHPTYAHLHDKAAQFVEMIGGKATRNLARTRSLLFPGGLLGKEA